MTTVHEKMAALRVAALHTADREWVLRQLPPARSARLRLLLAHPTVRAATRAGITVDQLQLAEPESVENAAPLPAVDAWTDHLAEWHPDWASLIRTEDNLPPALAESLRSYRKDLLKESA
jgi:hypothetical protein